MNFYRLSTSTRVGLPDINALHQCVATHLGRVINSSKFEVKAALTRWATKLLSQKATMATMIWVTDVTIYVAHKFNMLISYQWTLTHIFYKKVKCKCFWDGGESKKTVKMRLRVTFKHLVKIKTISFKTDTKISNSTKISKICYISYVLQVMWFSSWFLERTYDGVTLNLSNSQKNVLMGFKAFKTVNDASLRWT